MASSKGSMHSSDLSSSRAMVWLPSWMPSVSSLSAFAKRSLSLLSEFKLGATRLEMYYFQLARFLMSSTGRLMLLRMPSMPCQPK